MNLTVDGGKDLDGIRDENRSDQMGRMEGENMGRDVFPSGIWGNL